MQIAVIDDWKSTLAWKIHEGTVATSRRATTGRSRRWRGARHLDEASNCSTQRPVTWGGLDRHDSAVLDHVDTDSAPLAGRETGRDRRRQGVAPTARAIRCRVGSQGARPADPTRSDAPSVRPTRPGFERAGSRNVVDLRIRRRSYAGGPAPQDLKTRRRQASVSRYPGAGCGRKKVRQLVRSGASSPVIRTPSVGSPRRLVPARTVELVDGLRRESGRFVAAKRGLLLRSAPRIPRRPRP